MTNNVVCIDFQNPSDGNPRAKYYSLPAQQAQLPADIVVDIEKGHWSIKTNEGRKIWIFGGAQTSHERFTCVFSGTSSFQLQLALNNLTEWLISRQSHKKSPAKPKKKSSL